MSGLGAKFAADVLAACRERAGALSEVLARALEGRPEIGPGGSSPLDLARPPAALTGPGLALVAQSVDAAVLVALPEVGGLAQIRSLGSEPDGARKLADFAQALAAGLLPASFQLVDCRAARVDDLAAALQQGQAAADSHVVQIEVSQGGQEGVLFVIGSLNRPGDVLRRAAGGEGGRAEAAGGPGRPKAQNPSFEEGVRRLPTYSRSLLKINVPVVVTLATAKQPLRHILELVPGAIIQFDKSCEDPLNLSVGNQEVAVGQAVKVGDKFGLRITSITMPRERFQPVKGRPGGSSGGATST